MNRQKRWRTLRFEGLETRVLFAADLFAAVDAPVTDICVASYCETATATSNADSGLAQVTGEQVVHVSISKAEDTAISDLAFAQLGSEVSAERPLG